MILIVGLGNPGEKYAKTRHNLGFMVVEKLGEEWDVGSGSGREGGKWVFNKRFNAEYCQSKTGVILAKPMTFMNASGFAVSLISQYLNISISNLWVVHDDVDLPLGKIKIRMGGAAAGHHGVESIIAQLGTDQFVRFRLGIGHPGRGADALVERYVLREFDVNEKTEVKQMIKKAVKAIEVALKDGLERAMSRFNQ